MRVALEREWISLECELDYVIGSAFRFMRDWAAEDVAAFVARCREGKPTPQSLVRQKVLV